MGFARIYLLLIAAMSLVFGAIYFIAPAIMTDPTGFGVLAPAALTDVRATYGGFQLGSGLFLLWSAAQPERIRSALLLVVLTFAAVAICRGIGMLLDGQATSFLINGLITEVVLTLLALFALARVSATAPVAGARPA
jgi:hypothetical protein